MPVFLKKGGLTFLYGKAYLNVACFRKRLKPKKRFQQYETQLRYNCEIDRKKLK